MDVCHNVLPLSSYNIWMGAVFFTFQYICQICDWNSFYIIFHNTSVSFSLPLILTSILLDTVFYTNFHQRLLNASRWSPQSSSYFALFKGLNVEFTMSFLKLNISCSPGFEWKFVINYSRVTSSLRWLLTHVSVSHCSLAAVAAHPFVRVTH